MGKVLVTGGSGFVASYIILELLARKHCVVATLRSQSKVDALRPIIPADAAPLMTYAIVEDVSNPGAFDTVLAEHTFHGIIHTASPFYLHNKDPEELLKPAVNGTKNLLDAVRRLAPTVKRFVITSSHAAIVDLSKLHRPGYQYTAEDWNPIDWKTANEDHPVYNYVGSKKFAELAAWDFVKEYPALEVTAICPPSVYGPLLVRPQSFSALNTSNAFIYAYISGALKGAEVPQQFFHGWVDVRNVAQAHVTAYESPSAANRRFVLWAGNHTYAQVGAVIAHAFPDLAANVPTKLHDGLTPEGVPVEGRHTFDAGPSEQELGIEYMKLEKSLVDAVNSLRGFENS
ncbi:putative dihydroflavonal-4-reductase [Gautieria morchelliformis]|nr:putative dihydroflavonal-4-reductase [Gautieria morchelliformis]